MAQSFPKVMIAGASLGDLLGNLLEKIGIEDDIFENVTSLQIQGFDDRLFLTLTESNFPFLSSHKKLKGTRVSVRFNVLSLSS
jgi:hypothetical protein